MRTERPWGATTCAQAGRLKPSWQNCITLVPGQTTKGQSERSFFLYWLEGSRADLGILGGNDFGLWHRYTA